METAINIINEIWKDITGYEGLYQISNYGNVKSLAKSWIAGNGAIRKKTETLLSLIKNSKDYLQVFLYKNNTERVFTVHSLVYDMFGNDKRNGRIIQVDHKDGNRQNNHIDNLQLLTNRQNTSKGCLDKKKSGLPMGVTWNKRDGIYQAKIQINRKQIYLGSFNNPNDASMAYQKAIIYANQ